MRKRGIGIIRVSQRREREGESFLSPAEQRTRIDDWCERNEIDLLWCVEEIDVSGGTPLARRAGLSSGVEAVELGQADVVVVGYFDRLVRSIKVQTEVVGRVEAAGGEVVAVDYGRVSEETAAQWLSGTMIGAVNEYYRRAATERSRETQAAAVARGVPPFPLPPGLVKGEDGRPAGTELAGTVVEGFELRGEEATIKEVRAFWRERGIDRSYHGVAAMLTNRIYVGEIHFGKLVNLHAFDGIVPRPTFDRVQRLWVPRGRRGESDRLLARLGVLRCAYCGSRMNVGTQTQNGRRYPFYRCPTTGDCSRRQTIGAEIVERIVIAKTRQAIAHMEGRASAAAGARDAAEKAERDQADLDAAIRAFAGLEGEAAAIDRLAELRAARDASRAHADHLAHLHATALIRADDWDDLSRETQRALVRATIEVATVSVGKGAARVTVKAFGE